jgi:general secretion pathway protein K
MLGLEPIKFTSDADLTKQISTESKLFSIYSDGVVPGYRRTTRVRVHAVVDFRNAPPPGEGAAGLPLPGASGSGVVPGRNAAPVPSGPGGTGTTTFSGSGTNQQDALLGALAPNPGGSIIYYRIE